MDSRLTSNSVGSYPFGFRRSIDQIDSDHWMARTNGGRSILLKKEKDRQAKGGEPSKEEEVKIFYSLLEEEVNDFERKSRAREEIVRMCATQEDDDDSDGEDDEFLRKCKKIRQRNEIYLRELQKYTKMIEEVVKEKEPVSITSWPKAQEMSDKVGAFRYIISSGMDKLPVKLENFEIPDSLLTCEDFIVRTKVRLEENERYLRKLKAWKKDLEEKAENEMKSLEEGEEIETPVEDLNEEDSEIQIHADFIMMQTSAGVEKLRERKRERAAENENYQGYKRSAENRKNVLIAEVEKNGLNDLKAWGDVRFTRNEYWQLKNAGHTKLAQQILEEGRIDWNEVGYAMAQVEKKEEKEPEWKKYCVPIPLTSPLWGNARFTQAEYEQVKREEEALKKLKEKALIKKF